MSPRIGIIDSGVSQAFLSHVALSRCFDGREGLAPAHVDQLGHGDQVARLIVSQCADARLLVAQVFTSTLHAPVTRIAEAIYWLVASGAQLINMSFGLPGVSSHLADACRYAVDRGVVLFASAPSCGGNVVYPAALTECISVTGDPRCAEDEFAWLGLERATFGACSLLVPGSPGQGGGASFACARFTGIAGRLMGCHEGVQGRLSTLRARAVYVGPEERRA